MTSAPNEADQVAPVSVSTASDEPLLDRLNGLRWVAILPEGALFAGSIGTMIAIELLAMALFVQQAPRYPELVALMAAVNAGVQLLVVVWQQARPLSRPSTVPGTFAAPANPPTPRTVGWTVVAVVAGTTAILGTGLGLIHDRSDQALFIWLQITVAAGQLAGLLITLGRARRIERAGHGRVARIDMKRIRVDDRRPTIKERRQLVKLRYVLPGPRDWAA